MLPPGNAWIHKQIVSFCWNKASWCPSVKCNCYNLQKIKERLWKSNMGLAYFYLSYEKRDQVEGADLLLVGQIWLTVTMGLIKYNGSYRLYTFGAYSTVPPSVLFVHSCAWFALPQPCENILQYSPRIQSIHIHRVSFPSLFSIWLNDHGTQSRKPAWHSQCSVMTSVLVLWPSLLCFYFWSVFTGLQRIGLTTWKEVLYWRGSSMSGQYFCSCS